jgi:16S rRNA (cytidine1402-2'-O)-methyltransferase
LKTGTLYLIPTTLGDRDPFNTIPREVFNIIDSIEHFIVENEKTTRHYLKKCGIKRPLQEIELFPLNHNTPKEVIPDYLKPLLEGKDMGIISEAGCPGVADPGAEAVRLAHRKKIKVVPLTGPSSILLALMASGMNGQNFCFNGYLPKDRNERIKRIKELEKAIRNTTQIFIETPYRNQHLFEDLIAECDKNTLLCIATDITLSTEVISTRTIAEWLKNKEIGTKLNKRPSVFLLGA